MKPNVTSFFDNATNTISYVVADPNGNSCAIIDSVLDFDFSSGRTDTAFADKIIGFINEEGLTVEWLLESHVHADHLSAAPYLQERIGGKIAIGENIKLVQDTFGKIFNEGTEFQRDGSQFDLLFKDGDSFHIGQMRGDVIHTPGHTLGGCCLRLIVDDGPDHLFAGDTLFQGSIGRTDLPNSGGDLDLLLRMIRERLWPLEEDTIVHPGHGPLTTIGQEKQTNPFLNDGFRGRGAWL